MAENKQNGSVNEEDASTVRALRLLIRMEEEKPENERDEALIAECIRGIADLKGVRSSHTQKEVDAVIAGLKERAAEKRSATRRHVLRWLIPIAAVFILTTTVVAAASVKSLRMQDMTKWFFSKLQPKTWYSDEDVDLIISDDIKEFATLEELAEAAEIPLLLPYDIEDELQNLSISFRDFGEIKDCCIDFEYRNFECSCIISYPSAGHSPAESFDSKIASYDTNIIEYEGKTQINWFYSGAEYTVMSQSAEVCTSVVEQFRLK